jgi:N-acetylglucosamine-6-sulfatase
MKAANILPRRLRVAVAVAGMVLVALGLPGKLASTAQATPSTPPNIVVITVDDLDAGAFYAATHVPVRPCPSCASSLFMPNTVSFLQKGGITFTNAFVSDALCCPSRASFLTGMYAHNHGVHHEQCLEFEYKDGMPSHGPGMESENNIAKWLKTDLNHSYYTGFMGKYLNGYGSSATGNSDCHGANYVPQDTWDWWDGLNTDGTGGDPQEMWDYWVKENSSAPVQYPCTGTPCDPANYQTTVLTGKAHDFITSNFPVSGKQSFFLWLTPTAPHLEDAQGQVKHCDYNAPFGPAYTIRTISPYDNWAEASYNATSLTTVWPTNPSTPISYNHPITNGPSFLNSIASLDGKFTCMQDLYRDQLESLKPIDNMLGSIGADLASTGVLNNTVIIFTSDNGFFHGEHRLQNKVLPYEESIRVPLVIWAGSGVVSPPPDYSTDDHVVLNTDFAPTLAELSTQCAQGVNCHNWDGRSLVPFIKRTFAGGTWRKQFLLEHYAGGGGDEDVGLTVPQYFGVRTTSEGGTLANDMYTEYANGDNEYYTSLADQTLGRYEDQNFYVIGCCTSLHTLVTDLRGCGFGAQATKPCADAEKE